jgi:hypothetical protein
MAENMAIRFVIDGGVSPASEMTLSRLNVLLDEHGVGCAILDVRQ